MKKGYGQTKQISADRVLDIREIGEARIMTRTRHYTILIAIGIIALFVVVYGFVSATWHQP